MAQGNGARMIEEKLLQNLFNEQCRTNFLLGQILDALQKPKRAAKQADEKSDLAKVDLAVVWNGAQKYYGEKLSAVIGMDRNGKRYKAARARWEEKPDREYWVKVIKRLYKSDFCLGKNDRRWKANFDWFIRPDTAARILEGIYDNGKVGPGSPANEEVDL